MNFDFLQGTFDLETIRLLSGSGPDVKPPHEGMPVFVAGKKLPLFNAYDALEMALRDELLSIISDKEVIDLVCNLMLDDFVLARDEACDVSDLDSWFTAANLAAACMMEMVLPKKLIWRISLRLQNCLRRLRKLTGSEEFLFS